MTFDPELAGVTAFRPFLPEDYSLVVDAWSKGWKMSPWAGTRGNHRVHQDTTETIEALLSRGAKILVACAAHKPSQILGYVCYETVKGGIAIHWLYSKDAFRSRGLGSELLRRAQEKEPHGRRFYTHRTRCSAYFPGWAHAPEIARRK